MCPVYLELMTMRASERASARLYLMRRRLSTWTVLSRLDLQFPTTDTHASGIEVFVWSEPAAGGQELVC